MKAYHEHLSPLAATDLVAVEVVRGRDFGCQWHFHPELEIIVILKGGTYRWIGDNISALRNGDLFLIGSNLPHNFCNDPAPGARFQRVNAIVVQFRPDFLGPTWLGCNDMSRVRQLCEQAGTGLEITGRTRSRATQLMKRAPRTRGIRRLILTLEILSLLSSSSELKHLASPGFAPEVQISDTTRMGMISDYIQRHMSEPIYLKQVAQHVGMSEVSFSRYFRQRTGKTFPAYINEMRVARVCRLLAETDATVTEIAMTCGFDSMANFEKQFADLEGDSPKAYRQKARRINVGTRKEPAA